MESKIPLKWSLLIISAVGIACSSIIYYSLLLDQSVLGSYTYTVKSFRRTAFPELPARLKIPKISIDVAIEALGLTPQGAVDVPKEPGNAGWFELSPRPGEKGSSVISGHYGWWKDNTPAVFYHLYKLDKGDKLYVEDKKGATTTFVVRGSKRYDAGANPTEVFGANDGKSHLNLVTCEGVWDEVSKSYSKRLVVFADKEIESEPTHRANLPPLPVK